MGHGKFTVNEVEDRTGVPAATLRQWERRYGYPCPERSGSGYRLYSEDDLRGIAVMKDHIDDGVPASRAAELAQRPTPDRGGARPADALRDDLIHALLDLDEVGADRVLGEAYALHPIETVLVDVIAPTMNDLGRRWHEGEIPTTTEHVASNYVHGKLRGLLALTGAHYANPKVVIACAPHDHHELGALMLAVLLRRSGYRVIYVGPDTPTDDLAALVREHAPTALMVSASTRDSIRALEAGSDALRALATPVFYGGAAFNADPDAADALGGTYLSGNVVDAVARFDDLVASRSASPDASEPSQERAS